METAILLLGTNLGDRAKNLQMARSRIDPGLGSILSSSSVYETQPWGMESGNNFYNQCISLSTSLGPSGLLQGIKNIEKEMGRERIRGDYRDRTIDMDILFYGEREVNLHGLTIPHPRIRERRFAMIPVLELYPEFIYPSTGEKLKEILESCRDTLSVEKVS